MGVRGKAKNSEEGRQILAEENGRHTILAA